MQSREKIIIKIQDGVDALHFALKQNVQKKAIPTDLKKIISYSIILSKNMLQPRDIEKLDKLSNLLTKITTLINQPNPLTSKEVSDLFLVIEAIHNEISIPTVINVCEVTKKVTEELIQTQLKTLENIQKNKAAPLRQHIGDLICASIAMLPKMNNPVQLATLLDLLNNINAIVTPPAPETDQLAALASAIVALNTEPNFEIFNHPCSTNRVSIKSAVMSILEFMAKIALRIAPCLFSTDTASRLNRSPLTTSFSTFFNAKASVKEAANGIKQYYEGIKRHRAVNKSDDMRAAYPNQPK